MMRHLVILAGLLAATPALAGPLTKAQLDCAIAKSAPGTGDGIAAAMLTMNRAALDPLRQKLGGVVRQCVVANKLVDAQGEAYYNYAFARLPHEALGRQLAKAGVPLAKVNAALTPDPANPDEATARLSAAGFTEVKLGKAVWDKLGLYAALGGKMRQYLARLG